MQIIKLDTSFSVADIELGDILPMLSPLPSTKKHMWIVTEQMFENNNIKFRLSCAKNSFFNIVFDSIVLKTKIFPKPYLECIVESKGIHWRVDNFLLRCDMADEWRFLEAAINNHMNNSHDHIMYDDIKVYADFFIKIKKEKNI